MVHVGAATLCEPSRPSMRKGVSYRWIDIDQDADGCDFVKRVNNGMKSVPTIVFPDGDLLVEPSKMELANKLSDLKEVD